MVCVGLESGVCMWRWTAEGGCRGWILVSTENGGNSSKGTGIIIELGHFT